MTLLSDFRLFQKSLNATPHGKCCYGWHQKSVGQAISLPGTGLVWAQATHHPSFQAGELFRRRLSKKDQIACLRAPKLIKVYTQNEACQTCWLEAFVKSPAMSETATPQNLAVPTDSWFDRLEKQLDCLSGAQTSFQSCRQDFVTRRIHERYGNHLCTKINHWQTIHGDIHWGNVAQDGTLFDWEGWGMGPRYLDFAFLYGYTASCPTMCKILRARFPFLFSEQEGRICLLFVCSELLRMCERHGDHPHLKIPLEALARTLLVQMEST